ncbi:MAG: CRISPR-associated protein Cas4 [Leptospirillum sp.]
MALDPLLKESIAAIMKEAEDLDVHGLAFQHILLCPTRTWLHHYRLDCAHLNRHMQRGLLIHENAGGRALNESLYGLSPDRVDWTRREVSEIKKSRSHEESLVNQLLYYLSALTLTTEQIWKGFLRYTTSRRIKPISLDASAIGQLQRSLVSLREVLRHPLPPAKEEKPVCRGCSYSLLCWGRSTDDEDA